MENKISYVRQDNFCRTFKKICGEALHLGWIICGKTQKQDDFGLLGDIRTFRLCQSRRCGNFRRYSLWITSPIHFHLSMRACGEISALPLFHRGVESLSTHPTRRLVSKKGDFSQKQGDFGELHKLSNTCLCKTSFFHTVFHNLWKSRGKIRKGCAEVVEKP